MADLLQFIDDIGADKHAMVVTRLEDRAQMPKFAAMRENYFDKIRLPITGRIHELGCGTGAVCRAIASRPGFVGAVVGSDLSASLIETARDITAKSDLKNIEYYQADGQGSDVHDGQYDLVLAHTVISHVAHPATFLHEATRLARPGGQIILHDGDGGFKWSSQHLDGSCNEHSKTALGSFWAGALVFTRSTAGGRARGAAAILGSDCGGRGE